MNNFIRNLIVPGLVLFTLACLPSMAAAQGFDIEGYLKKKDANNNGKVEPEEMSSNTRNYINKLGLDASKPVSISKIVSRVKKNGSAKANAAKRSSSSAKVPGFGVDESEKSGVSSFSFNSSASKAGSTKNGASMRYSESVTRQVDSTLEKYDRNRDGALDKSEQSRARWGSPKPEQSDLNKDGRLSRDELAKRYKGREDYYKKSKSSNERSKAAARAAEDRARRDRERRSSSRSTSSRSSSTRKSTSSTSSRTTTAKKVDKSKYLKYAQSLVESYDKDKDGKLSKDEVKSMRRPPTGADTNKDGFISEQELVDSLSGGSSKSKSPASSSSSSSSSRGSYRSRSRSSSSRTSSFSSLDANKDSQIHMHEYSKEWNDEIVAEFYEKDKNGDGIISSKEWSAKK